MKQIVLESPGRFAMRTVQPPTTQQGHVLVRIHRVGICGTDLHAFRGRQPFFSYPRVLGHELAAEVLDTSRAEESGLQPGDRCSVEPYLNCGSCIACRRGRPNCCTQLKVLGVHVDGGMGDLMVVPAAKLHRSAQLEFDQLALVETLAIGAHAVERAAIEPGENVLVVGAGPIGLATVQFAQASGGRVLVMDLNEGRLRFCRQHLQVTETIHPGMDTGSIEDQLRTRCDGDLPTAVFDATGHAGSMAQSFTYAAPTGRLVFVGLVQGELSFNDPEFHRRELTLLASRNALPSTFRGLIAAIEGGTIDTTPWITHRLSLADVPDQFKTIASDTSVIKAMITVDT